MGLSCSSLEICSDSQRLSFRAAVRRPRRSQLGPTHLHLRVGPAGHLNNHVEDGLLLVGVERDVVPWRDELAVLLDVDAVLEGVGSANLAGGVRHGGWGLRGSCVDGCGRRSCGVEMACK